MELGFQVNKKEKYITMTNFLFFKTSFLTGFQSSFQRSSVTNAPANSTHLCLHLFMAVYPGKIKSHKRSWQT